MIYISVALLAFAALVFSVLLTPLVRRLAISQGWVDRPDGGRKTHEQPLPRLGGIAIVAAYWAALALVAVSPAGEVITESLPFALKLLPAVGLVFLIGLIDDIAGLTPWQKLSGQFAAALLAYYFAGVHIQSVAGHAPANWCYLPFTIAWLVVCTNAVNLIDGLDGLAAGVGLFATVTAALAAIAIGSTGLLIATAPLAGALLGFLVFNFNPASIFLGDCGSLTVGFLLGCYGAIWTEKSATLLGMTAPLVAYSLPLIDTAVAIGRRFLRHQPIFGADRSHIHHRLLDRGLTPRRAALLLYGVCALSATLSLLLSLAGGRLTGLIVVIFCVGACMAIHRLGYIEFEAARRLILHSAFRKRLNAVLCLDKLEGALATCRTLEQCFLATCVAGRELGFLAVRLEISGDSFEETLASFDGGNCWTMRVPLVDRDFAEVTVPFGAATQAASAASFADVLRGTLAARIAATRPRATERAVRSAA